MSGGHKSPQISSRKFNSTGRDPRTSEMDIDVSDIIQLPTHQIYDQMPIDFDRDEDPDPPVADAAPTIALPPRFILVNHHPHANKPDEIIPLDRSSSLVPLSEDDPRPAPLPDVRPWAPFKTYSDYKFTSRRVRRRAPNAEIDEDLDNHHTRAFSSDCFITSRNHREMEKCLAAARTGNISFCRKILTIDFEGTEFGGTYEVEVEFRDPCMTSRGPGGTGNASKIPSPPTISIHHVWLDKGSVSMKVKMHPILFRGCWIHSTTRNGSGNGGSALAGFVKMQRSSNGHTTARLYALAMASPVSHIQGFLIESMDFEELAAWLAIRNSTSLHPCHQCLACKDDLPRLTRGFTERTTESISNVLARAPVGKTDRNEYLKQYGLHDFEMSNNILG
ncbi:hypothetical protein B0H14DRAFT_2556684 [Mycena olivaceomarginata]|nr:hypothetical protein B0H14DRAFT_2556684 [Mycena olivaceomarginata]